MMAQECETNLCGTFLTRLHDLNNAMYKCEDPSATFSNLIPLIKGVVRENPGPNNVRKYTLADGMSADKLLGSFGQIANILSTLTMKMHNKNLPEKLYKDLQTLRSYAHIFNTLIRGVLDWRRINHAYYFQNIILNTGRYISFLIEQYEKQELRKFKNLETSRLQAISHVKELLPDPEHPEECGICYGVVLGPDSNFAFLQNCPHVMCMNCASTWFMENTTCPFCRERGAWMCSAEFQRVRSEEMRAAQTGKDTE